MSTNSTDQIDSEEVNQALAGTRLGGSVLHFASVESTNTLALGAAREGAPGGAWVADEQTAGRGRGGHTWHSAPGEGLYVSGLWTPRLPATPYDLSLAAGLAAWEAIQEVAGITVDLRWPNDLVSRGEPPSRKLGGILTETATQPAISWPQAQAGQPPFLRYAVIGIGINVAHRCFPPHLEREATSLRLLGWEQSSRQALLISLLRKLDLYIRKLEDAYGGTEDPLDVWARLPEASTWLRGKRVRVGGETDSYTGVTAGLDAQGFLRVKAEDGILRTVRLGGVREA